MYIGNQPNVSSLIILLKCLLSIFVYSENLYARLTGSELQGQEEAACMCPDYTTADVLFTGTNGVKMQALLLASSLLLASVLSAIA